MITDEMLHEMSMAVMETPFKRAGIKIDAATLGRLAKALRANNLEYCEVLMKNHALSLQLDPEEMMTRINALW